MIKVDSFCRSRFSSPCEGARGVHSMIVDRQSVCRDPATKGSSASSTYRKATIICEADASAETRNSGDHQLASRPFWTGLHFRTAHEKRSKTLPPLTPENQRPQGCFVSDLTRLGWPHRNWRQRFAPVKRHAVAKIIPCPRHKSTGLPVKLMIAAKPLTFFSPNGFVRPRFRVKSADMLIEWRISVTHVAGRADKMPQTMEPCVELSYTCSSEPSYFAVSSRGQDGR